MKTDCVSPFAYIHFTVRHKNQISPADKTTFPDISNIDQKSYFVEH